MGRYRANITIAIRYGVRYLLSNSVIANVVHRDPDLYFQGYKISGNHIIIYIWKTVRASKKCFKIIFIEVDITHRMATLRMLYTVSFTYIFKFTTFLEIIIFNISITVSTWKKCSRTSFIEVDTSHRITSLKY